MKLVKLEDVCYNGSSSLSQKDIIMLEGKYPVYGASGLIKYINFYKYDKEYIAIVKDGAGIGRTMILPANSSVISTLQYIFPKENINIRYLYYALNAMDLSKYYSGVTIPHIYFKDYKKEELYLPIIDEQINIVNKLDKIREIIDIRKKQIEELDEIIKSQFIEMFERGQYPKDEFINIAKEIYAGGDKPKDISKVQDDEYLYPVFANGYENEGLQGYSKSYRTGDNAVTISARGTIGYSFIRNEKFTPIVRLITIIPHEKANIVYLKYAIDNLNIAGSGTSQAQLTVPDIKKKKITIPPIELQNKFADIVKQIDKQKFEIQNSLEEMQKLQESLMNKYFG